MEKVYYYPPASKGGYSNPYSINFKKALSEFYEVLDSENKPSSMLSFSFLLNSVKANLYIINWLESVCFLRFSLIQYFFARLGLLIIKLRKKKIVWIFHNIHPHQGSNKYSKKIQKILFDQSSLIISHSIDAANYAKEHTKTKVLYACHPIQPIKLAEKFIPQYKNIDIFIWGSIQPYKGIVEFITLPFVRNSDLNVLIIGKCENQKLSKQITENLQENIIFENRQADFSEIKAYCETSSYVVFPYIGTSVSSSGALIDTIAFKGTPVGPSKGAFKDLEQDGMCIVYHNDEELKKVLIKNQNLFL